VSATVRVGLKYYNYRESRKLRNEELHDLYSSPNVIPLIKSRTRLAGHVARMGRGDMHTGFWWGDLKVRDHLEDPSVDGSIILRWIFRKWDGRHGPNCSGSGWGQVAGSCTRGNELSDSTKCEEFLG